MLKSIFPVPRGTWAGMTEAQVIAARNGAQVALQQLLSGKRPASVSYAQGDGSRSVSFSNADQAQLRQNIREFNILLGVECRRRPMRPYFR
ncbi:hypothetical protein AA103196_2281 [Ameyamaea chiangmaiensis NBRC 103196]|uniref:Phage head-tail adapter protein n=2 Tax=Ameyamaea chiangmaiensis TaxID=442969 RepID=A0A850P4X8_9PROT|nr:phage head-tail adapter protein [Ameyamaea chiangmaiensis]NVN39008.1 phage head-tail adapter protein [Ameyamaea chiangmaiensis]GBQ69684.1 hypothetical protein AA103196_2281 [Ameyamaea chiangmaiensis NBRC 103196]